jgi:hypothetical protein
LRVLSNVGMDAYWSVRFDDTARIDDGTVSESEREQKVVALFFFTTWRDDFVVVGLVATTSHNNSDDNRHNHQTTQRTDTDHDVNPDWQFIAGNRLFTTFYTKNRSKQIVC